MSSTWTRAGHSVPRIVPMTIWRGGLSQNTTLFPRMQFHRMAGCIYGMEATWEWHDVVLDSVDSDWGTCQCKHRTCPRVIVVTLHERKKGKIASKGNSHGAGPSSSSNRGTGNNQLEEDQSQSSSRSVSVFMSHILLPMRVQFVPIWFSWWV